MKVRVAMERTDDLDVLPDRFDLVGCRVEDNDSAFRTLRQDAHSKGSRLMGRDCIKGNMNTIASCLLQLLDRIGCLVLHVKKVGDSQQVPKSVSWLIY